MIGNLIKGKNWIKIKEKSLEEQKRIEEEKEENNILNSSGLQICKMRRGLKQMFYGNTNEGDIGIEYQQPPQQIRRPFGGSAPPPIIQQQQIQQTPPLQRPAGFLHKILRSGGVTVDLNNQQQQQQQYSPKQQQQQPIPFPRKVSFVHKQQPLILTSQQLEGSIDGDYAEIEQTWKQQRNVNAPLSPKTVKFGDSLKQQQNELFIFPQQQQQKEVKKYTTTTKIIIPNQRQQAISQSLYTIPQKIQQGINIRGNIGNNIYQPPTQQREGGGIGGGGPQHSASSEEAGAALDEAARDLLRLSEEPVSFNKFIGNRNVQKAASTSQMQQQQQQTLIPREVSPDTISATIGAVEQGRRATAPFAGLNRPVSGQPWPQIPIMTEQGGGNGITSSGDGHRPGPPPDGKVKEEENIGGLLDEGPDHIFIHRHVEREHVLETEQKRPLPPVVKTTVEGKLKMEKSVGSHLIRCDHEIAKAYTVRDTLTHYRIRTIIGKRQLLIEEIQKASSDLGEERGKAPTVRSSGTYRLSVFEDGKEIGTHEADIQLPENISKPDYLTKLSERLLSDLASLDDSQEQITAVTRVEIECIEDVTDIVKTYRIGLAAPKEEEQPILPIQLPTKLAPPAEEFAYESASDHLSELGPIELESRVYIDQLEPEELERRDIRLMQEGRLFEDKARIGIQPRTAEEMSEESIESVHKPPIEISALVDCELQRNEDRSLMEVYIAVPLLQHLTVILRLHREKRRRTQKQQQIATGYGYERQGRRYHDITRLTKTSRFESEESLEPIETPPIQLINIPIPPTQLLPTIIPQQQILQVHERLNEQQRKELIINEPMGTSFDYQLAGQQHEGRAFLRTQGRLYSEESSVSSYGGTTIEPQPGIYSMEISGQLIEGMDKLRPMKRYESETSIDYEERAGIGGITHVNMVRKEDKGSFELTIICDNKWNILPLPLLNTNEKPKQRYEAMEFIKTIEKERIENAQSEIIKKCSNNLISNFNAIAQQSNQITLFCSFENNIQIKDFLIEKLYKSIPIERISPFFATEFISENVNLSLSIGASGRLLIAPDVFKILNERRESHGHKFNTIAQQMSQLTQHVHLERKEYENKQFNVESIPIRLPRIDTIHQNIREFSIKDEHCSVLMEHRNVIGEQTTKDWGYSVTGPQLRFHWSAPPPGLEERPVPSLSPPLSPRVVSSLDLHQRTSTIIHESDKQRFAVSHFVALSPPTKDARLAESIKASASWVETLPVPQPLTTITIQPEFKQQKKIAQKDVQIEGPQIRAKSVQLEQPWREDRTIQVIELIKKPELIEELIQTEKSKTFEKSTQMEEGPKQGKQTVQSIPQIKQICSVQTVKEEQKIKSTQSEQPSIREKTSKVELPSLGKRLIQVQKTEQLESISSQTEGIITKTQEIQTKSEIKKRDVQTEKEIKEDYSQTEEIIKKKEGRTISVDLPSLTSKTTQAQRIEQQLMAIQTEKEIKLDTKTIKVEEGILKRRSKSIESERIPKGIQSIQGQPEIKSKGLESSRASTEERTIQTIEIIKQKEVKAVQSEPEIIKIHSFQTRPEFGLKSSETDLTQLKEEGIQLEKIQIKSQTVQSLKKEEQTKEIQANPLLGGKEFQTEKEIKESRETQVDKPLFKAQEVQSEILQQTTEQTQVEEIKLGKCCVQTEIMHGIKSIQMKGPELKTQEIQVKPFISTRLLQTGVINQLEMSTQSERLSLEAKGTQIDKIILKGKEVQSDIIEQFGRGTQSEVPQQSCQAIQAVPWMEGRIAQTESPEQRNQFIQSDKPILRSTKAESIPKEIYSKLISSEEIKLIPKSVSSTKQEIAIGETQMESKAILMRTVSADEIKKIITNEMFSQTIGIFKEEQGTMTIEENKKEYKSWEGQVYEKPKEEKEEQIICISKQIAKPEIIETGRQILNYLKIFLKNK
ncbi:hypothetical protein Mgra_00001463 [Meloidogyne graminicola]|uniref:Uncharacterized protein n=1 Tax=Meloidogyne graminicola TaxID=189291 RepID=A0A8T0A071_9BILA|nr:hypothetical protein Mgra_00001463 [Meloidogyne graminicola]